MSVPDETQRLHIPPVNHGNDDDNDNAHDGDCDGDGDGDGDQSMMFQKLHVSGQLAMLKLFCQ